MLGVAKEFEMIRRTPQGSRKGPIMLQVLVEEEQGLQGSSTQRSLPGITTKEVLYLYFDKCTLRKGIDGIRRQIPKP